MNHRIAPTAEHFAAVDAAVTAVFRSATVEAGLARAAETLRFEGRDAYVSFVAAWKARLAVSVADVRAAKRLRSSKSSSDTERESAQSRRETLRRSARLLLAVRALAKDLARAARAPAEAA
jgi:hypothetical protein